MSRSLSSTFACGSTLYRRNAVSATAIAALAYAPAAIVDAMVARSAIDTAVSVGCSWIGFFALLYLLVPSARAGKSPALVASQFGSVLLELISYTAAVLVGLVLFVVPGLILFARGSMIFPLTIAERAGPWSAWTRSWRLVSGHTVEVGGGLLMISVAALIPGVAASYLDSAATSAVVIWGWASVTVPWATCWLVATYLLLAQPVANPAQPTLDSSGKTFGSS
jgi:hypothetical protein